ncbi:MAG: hypothetical protein QOF78_4000 [Phycisphaerales bacterium]|nr:hypothetical protein [Phycisphaerales bacterium]
MKRVLMSLGVFMVCVMMLVAAAPPAGDDAAMKLAKDVVKAGGGDNWGKVKRIQFTFNVLDKDGKPLMAAKHDWDLRAGTDTVAWNDKNVTIKFADANDAGDAKAAYQRWVNDSYWLLMPLKLLDGGVKLAHGGAQDVDGQKYEVLNMSFESVGLTPGDRYNLYIDPQEKLVRRWDYMPSAEKKTSGTWDGYEQFGPLKLATKHQFGDKQINFTDVKVETD